MRHHLGQQLQRAASFSVHAARSFTSGACLHRIYREGDIVILRPKRGPSATHDGLLVKLNPTKTVSTHQGVLEHTDILGKEPRQTVYTSRGAAYRVHEPTLAEYVRLSRRIVTPIYAFDANLIVSLLDIHVDTYDGPTTEPPLEILEAGTGHGSLTLHLSRAIHAANPPLSSVPSQPSAQEEGLDDREHEGESPGCARERAWKATRRAIVHTLDIEPKNSKHARDIVHGFKQGMYSRNIDFYAGDIHCWCENQMEIRKSDKPFLSHAILDLPNADSHFEKLAPAIRSNGILAVFAPSITQIVDSVKVVRDFRLPFLFEQVLELGTGMIREWDVRAVRPRSTLGMGETRDASLAEEHEMRDLGPGEGKWVTICRPKVGERVVGGGFLILWRKMEPAAEQPSAIMNS